MQPKKQNRIPFARPFFSDKEEKEIVECLRSGWITTGPRVKKFEDRFAGIVSSPEAVAVSSGTAGLHLSLMAMDLQPGDEVVTPSFTWVSVPNLIVLLGAKPVFCDIDLATLNLDPDGIENCITPKTRAIVVVHFAGRPVDLCRIREIADKHRIPIIEDACHAVGARVADAPVGSHSPLCVFSFHPNKNITTGEGGMVTGTDLRRLNAVRQMRFHGVVRSAYDRFAGKSLPHYETVSPGFKYNMTDLAAAIGIHQLEKLAFINDKRQQLAENYRAMLSDLTPDLNLPPAAGGGIRHAWHLYTVRVADRQGFRDSTMAGLLEDGIQTGLHYLPVHEMPYFRKNGFSPSLSNTEKAGRTILSLPLYPDMTESEQQYVADCLRKRILR